MFEDPTIVKLIIIGLIGIIVVLTIAVIYLAIKKNTYYVDEDGNEITTFSTRKEEKTPLKPVTVEEQPQDEPEIPDIVMPEAEKEEPEGTLQVPLSAKPAEVSAVDVTVTVEDETTSATLSVLPCLIGRETTCGLVISEPAVSRRHAQLVSEHGSLYLEDVSGHNGTYLNGTKLPSLGKAKVQEGDVINLGRAEIVIEGIRR
ncbi:MAG: FHA domain-containing protein [Bulleidia sp.]